MVVPASATDRSDPTDVGCAPWPDDDVVQADADAAWAIDLGLVDLVNGAFPSTDPGHGPAEDALACLLERLEDRSRERHRATAAEYDLIFQVIADASADPDPWVGPDPTLDRLWSDPRGRTVTAVRRDRIDMAERAAVAEIAVRLRVAEQTVRARAAHAGILRNRCPRVWAAFVDGRLSERHAVETARLAASLPDGDPGAWAAFDDGALDRALRLSPARFATSARVLRERVHSESILERHRRARDERGVWLAPDLDGMATVTAYLPADRAAAALTRLDHAARHLAAVDGEERTLAQLRADAFADLLTETDPAPRSTPGRSGVAVGGTNRPGVVITIPALTLLGADTTPATIDGYGPVDLDTARRLAGEASSWIRLLTHPVTGAPLALDRTVYRVTAALRRWLGVTSPTCAFPGCGRPARECDLDHRRAWSKGGTTDADNLEPECRHHHRMRHETRWTPARDPDTGDLTWTSPLGARIDADPPPF